LTERVARQNRIIADVIDLVLAVSAVAQDHVGASAAGRRRIGRYREEEAVPVKSAIDIRSNNLAHIVDAFKDGALGSQGIVEGDVSAAAQEEAVRVATGNVITDDLARVIDAVRKGVPCGQGIVECEVGGKTPRLGSYRKPCEWPLASVYSPTI